MRSLQSTILLALFAVQASAHISYLLYTPTAQDKAVLFDKTASALCKDKPMTCIEPLLHKDFKFVAADKELNREQYLAFLKTQTSVVNDFKVDTANAKDVGAQVDVPVLANGKVHLHAFLVDDASVQGGIALIKIDKKNV